MERRRITFDDVNSGPEWVVVYHLGYADYDDDMDGEDLTEIILNAADFDVAVRYAQQYLKKMKTEEATSDKWSDAKILSVELY